MSSDTTNVQDVRRYAFYIAVVLAIGLPIFMIREAMLYVATGWTGFLGTHSVHDLVLFGVVWMALLGLAFQLYKPRTRVNAVLAMPLIMIPSAIIGLIAGTPIAMMGVIFGALGLLALALHPAGRSLLRFDRVASPNRLLVGLFAIGAVAMLAYGALELVKQFTLTNDHAAIQHYGNVAVAALYVAVMAGMATFRERDWRFAAWSAGFVALYIGASSAVFPAVASSLGVIGGLLVVVWALVFVGTVERTRGGLMATRSGTVEESAARTS